MSFGCSSCTCPETATPVATGSFTVSHHSEYRPNPTGYQPVDEPSAFPPLEGATLVISESDEETVVLEYDDEAGDPVRVVFEVGQRIN